MTEPRKLSMSHYATHVAKPKLGGFAWTTVYRCPVVGCEREAMHNRTSNRRMWRLCLRCARRFDQKPGHVRFTPHATITQIQIDHMRSNLKAQVDDALSNMLRASHQDGSRLFAHWGGKDATTGA